MSGPKPPFLLLMLIGITALLPIGRAVELGDWPAPALEFERRHGAALALYARAVLEAYARGTPLPRSDSLETATPVTGIFVTLLRAGRVRGCYGSVDTPAGSAAAFVRESVVGAASRDFRHEPVEPAEIPELTIVISLVGPLRPIDDPAHLNPRRHGLLVRDGERTSVLLPGEGRTAAWQMREALHRLGTGANRGAEYFALPARTILEPPREREKRK